MERNGRVMTESENEKKRREKEEGDNLVVRVMVLTEMNERKMS